MKSCGFYCIGVLACLAAASAAHIGCPETYQHSEEDRKAHLELEQYFVGHKHLPFLKPIDDFFDDTSRSFGLKSNQFRYIFCMLMMYPLALVHRLLPNSPTLKHIFTLTCGLSASITCFGVNTWLPLCSAVTVFVGLKIVFGSDTDAKHVRSSFVPIVGFAFMLAVVSAVHIFRMVIDYGGYTLDVSGPQMVITIKLCQVVWNVYDFRNKNPAYAHRDENAIDVKDLSLLSFLAYIFFFPGYLAGPAFEFQRYLAFTEMRSDYSLEHRPSIAASLPTCLKKLGIAVFMMLVVVLVASRFNVNWMLCESFDDLSLPLRIGYLHLATSLLRAKYYVAWCLAEGAIVLSGLGYNGKRKTWDAVDNCNIPRIELGQSIRESINNWNINTSRWLRIYVYERANEAKLGNLTATGLAFMTSAFWHGFYAGYYILFFCVGIFVQPLAKDLRRNLRPYFEDYSTGKTPLWYNVGGLLLTSGALNFFASPFGLLSFDSTVHVWRRVYCYGLAGTLLFKAVPFALKFLPSHKKTVQAHKAAIEDRKAAKKKT